MWVRENSLIFQLISGLKDSKLGLFLLTCGVCLLMWMCRRFWFEKNTFAGTDSWLGEHTNEPECRLHNKMRHPLPFIHNTDVIKRPRRRHTGETSVSLNVSFVSQHSLFNVFADSVSPTFLWFWDILEFTRAFESAVYLKGHQHYKVAQNPSSFSIQPGRHPTGSDKTRLDCDRRGLAEEKHNCSIALVIVSSRKLLEAAKWWRGHIQSFH